MATTKKKRMSKRDSTKEQLQIKRDSQKQSLYARSSLQLFKPSAKIKHDWTYFYTAQFQQLWNTHYLSILHKVTKSNGKKKNVPILLHSMCKSLQFGEMNLCFHNDTIKEQKSDILAFYFFISFQPQRNKHYFLHFKFLDDSLFKMRNFSEVRSKRVQISCDNEYGEVNKIINDSKALPSDLLIVVFEYIEPAKYLALYSYKEKESDDDFEMIQNDKFDKKYFKMSNIEWCANYFGVESKYFRRLFKILILFLDTKEVSEYIEKEKEYNKKWREWQEAQQDLNREYAESQSDDGFL